MKFSLDTHEIPQKAQNAHWKAAFIDKMIFYLSWLLEVANAEIPKVTMVKISGQSIFFRNDVSLLVCTFWQDWWKPSRKSYAKKLFEIITKYTSNQQTFPYYIYIFFMMNIQSRRWIEEKTARSASVHAQHFEVPSLQKMYVASAAIFLHVHFKSFGIEEVLL